MAHLNVEVIDQQCNHYNNQWSELCNYIASSDHWDKHRSRIGELQPLEAKALSIFSIARRMMNSAFDLVNSPKNKGNWKLVFVENSIILYPMLELIGHARMGHQMMRLRDARRDIRRTTDNLISGIWWLLNQDELPVIPEDYRAWEDNTRLFANSNYMPIHQNGASVSDIYLVRHFFIHGVMDWDEQRISMPDALNFEIPKAIAEFARTGLLEYWKLLKEDDGSVGWIDRLADARIQPFIIQTSELFDYGLIDPDILDNFLEV